MTISQEHTKFLEDNHLLRDVMEASRNILVIFDPSNRILLANGSFSSHFNLSSEKILGSDLPGLLKEIDPDAREKLASLVIKLENQENIDGIGVTIKDMDYEVFVSPVATKEYPGISLLSLKNVTEKNMAEKALKESEEQFRELVNNSLVGIFKSNLNGELLFANEESLRIFEYTSLEEAKNAGMLPLYRNLQDREMIIKLLKESGSVDKYEIELQSKTGKPKAALVSVILDEHGTAAGVIQDITNLKKTEDELMIKDAALNSSLTPFGIADMDGRIIYINPACYRFWGYDDDSDIIGTNVVDYFDHAKYQGVLEKVRSEGSWAGEHVAVRRDGSKVDIYLTTNILLDDSGKPICILASFMDISKIKSMKRQLITSEQQAVTGRLAASIAHEINSPLQAITVTLSNLMSKTGESKELTEGLSLLDKAFDNIRSTVRNLLDLNRPGAEIKVSTDVNNIIRMAADLVKGQLKEMKILLELDLAPDDTSADVSVQHMSQVFLNLFNNAMEAICDSDGRGSVQNTGPSTTGKITVKSYVVDDEVKIVISDTGVGLPESELEMIFDPFYSTKNQKGIGVGLTTCLAILRDHEGDIVAENSPEGGARFTMRLPKKGKGS